MTHAREAGAGAPLLAFDGVHKGFFGVPVLKDITLTLRAGEMLALIGENGAGKSTLMNILGGVLQADSGEIRIDGTACAPRSPGEAARQGIAFIHQELNLFTNLSIAENLFIKGFPGRRGWPFFDRRRMHERARELLRLVDLDLAPETPVESLAPGERQLVEIAKALDARARIIIFDEPTTSLTERETTRLFALIRKLRAQGTAMIYISHALADVARLADRIAVLRDGQITGAGPAAGFGIDRMISLMIGRELNQRVPRRQAAPSGEVCLRVQDISQPGVVRGIRFVLHRREILGVFGLMGAGRSELARILFGLDPFASGSLEVQGRKFRRMTPRAAIAAGLAFVTENRREEGLLMDASIIDNLALASLARYSRAGLLARSRLVRDMRGHADALQVRAVAPQRQKARALSGGNQQKVVIGKWAATQPRIFMLDEPTRGIDVGAKVEVYGIVQQLADAGSGVLVISSELEELMGLCDRILVMATGELRAEFAGPGYDRERILRAAFGDAGRSSMSSEEALVP